LQRLSIPGHYIETEGFKLKLRLIYGTLIHPIYVISYSKASKHTKRNSCYPWSNVKVRCVFKIQSNPKFDL